MSLLRNGDEILVSNFDPPFCKLNCGCMFSDECRSQEHFYGHPMNALIGWDRRISTKALLVPFDAVSGGFVVDAKNWGRQCAGSTSFSVMSKRALVRKGRTTGYIIIFSAPTKILKKYALCFVTDLTSKCNRICVLQTPLLYPQTFHTFSFNFREPFYTFALH